MYQYKSRVAFNETPDGLTLLFSTTEAFLPDSLVIVQGAIVWTDFTTPSTTTVLFGTAPHSVAEAGAIMIAVGLFGSGELTYPVGMWDAAAFQQARGLTDTSLTQIIPALEDADALIQSTITAAAYTDACATVPADALAARKIKQAIGDLATIYLRERNLIAPAASGYTEHYSGIVSYQLTSSGKATEASLLEEGKILNRLIDYHRPIALTPCVTWGTGRYLGVYVTDDETEIAV